MKPFSFDNFFSFVQLPGNDGQKYHVTPGDRGGPTAWGMTQANWDAWTQLHDMDVTLSEATQSDTMPIYRAWFWNAIQGDQVPAGLNLMLADFGVTSGIGHSVMMLQKYLNSRVSGIKLLVDGSMGQKSLEAIKQFNDPLTLVLTLQALQKSFYDDIPGHANDRGWYVRLSARAQLAVSCWV